jgi:hypothetical protein
MLRKLLLAVLLLIATSGAGARDFTDVYYDPAEAGWGFFLVQSDTFQFLAFFIYGPDNKPTWYVATLLDDGTGTYTGPVYAYNGTYFALPWNPAQFNPDAPPVGTATFQPNDIYSATFTYTINGVGTVTKTVQRQTLLPYMMSGNFSGSAAGSVTGCNDPTANIPSFRGRYNLSVTQVADTSVTLTLSFVDNTYNGLVCTLSGPLTHLGRLYQVQGQASCAGAGINTGVRAATIDSLHPTGQGIEWKWTGSLGGGCNGVFHFSAVFNANN